MPEENQNIRELEKLLSRQIDERLSEEELQRVQDLLRDDRDARRFYIRHCQMHAMLKEEQKVLAPLAEAEPPANIVPLPGVPASESAPTNKRSASGRAPLAIAAAILGALIIGGLLVIDRQNGGDGDSRTVRVKPTPPATVSPAEPRPDAVAKALSPEEEYHDKLLAMADGGSQNRPPTPFTSDSAPPPGKVDFNRDIRPVLSDNCFHCHGPSEADRKADLRLDTAEGIVADLGGYAAVAPGDPEASELVARILENDLDEVMPPPKSHKKLTSEQRDLFVRWVAEGAEWRDHWAFEPVVGAEPPEIAGSDGVRNEIDRFILGRLEQARLKPSPEADRRTLIRRVSLDLTGLPPAPEEVEAFLEDESEEAYEKLVDRLLASPRYGEHRARYWLDAARYGDTHGLHLDNYREIWPYRDWVIRAYNSNMPFDRFTVEQLAGDLLPEATLDQRVATGFNRCNVTTSEGGAIKEEFAARYAVDRVATTSTVWMGLTTGCAVCHDHKYDPISMKEFYQLYAYFNNTTEDPMDGNIEDTPPVIRIYGSPGDEAKEKELQAQIRKFDGRLKKIGQEAEADFTAWLAAFTKETAKRKQPLGLEGRALRFDRAAEAGGAAGDDAGRLVPVPGGAELAFGSGRPFTLRIRFKYPEAKRGRWNLLSKLDPGDDQRGFRVALDGQGISVELVQRWPDRALQAVTNRGYSTGAEKEVFVTYDGSGKAEGIMTYQGGKPLGSRFNMIRKNNLDGEFASGGPLLVALPGTYTKEPGVGVSELEIYDRQLSDVEILALSKERAVSGLLAKAIDHLAKSKPEEKKAKPLPDRDALLTHYLLSQSGPYRNAMIARAAAGTELDQLYSRTATTLVMQEEPEGMPVAHILERGEYDKPGEEVAPGVPEVLPALPDDAPPNRLALARWLVDPAHPLTARVTVNRMWQELFGTGIVKTSEDFGTQGEPPSHPELLDWLAAEFVASGWDSKALYKKMLLSATYRQSSKVTPHHLKRDPENRLFARGPRYRFDAETIRDLALYVSDLLVDHLGGPSVRPYQPGGLWKTVGYSGSNTVEFHQDHGDALYRRSLYTFWKRTSHPPNMAAFDAPNRESCTVRRERTNTPLQALVLMNDPQFVEAARHLAARILDAAPSDRIDYAFTIVLGRPADAEEKKIVADSLRGFLEEYRADPGAARKLLSTGDSACEEGIDPADHAAWTMLANQLLNLDEAITKN